MKAYYLMHLNEHILFVMWKLPYAQKLIEHSSTKLHRILIDSFIKLLVKR